MTLTKYKVLLIDDDPKLGDLIRHALDGDAYELATAQTAKEGIALLANDTPDVVLLDVMLPDSDGFDTCKRLRKQGLTIPVILLTALSETSDVIEGLDAGADDHLAKPFEIEELAARIRAHVRRHRESKETTLAFHDVRIDLAKRTVTRGDTPLSLTAKEFELLEYLMRNPNRVLSRSAIIERVWNKEIDSESNAIDVCISTLRKKIDKPFDPKLIYTVIGTGYVFSAEGPPV